MSAELLRRASALMRKRADVAGRELVALNSADPGHIASWHPAVALAVAAWLDAEASNRDAGIGGHAWGSVGGQADALAVARAYLGIDLTTEPGGDVERTPENGNEEDERE